MYSCTRIPFYLKIPLPTSNLSGHMVHHLLPKFTRPTGLHPRSVHPSGDQRSTQLLLEASFTSEPQWRAPPLSYHLSIHIVLRHSALRDMSPLNPQCIEAADPSFDLSPLIHSPTLGRPFAVATPAAMFGCHSLSHPFPCRRQLLPAFLVVLGAREKIGSKQCESPLAKARGHPLPDQSPSRCPLPATEGHFPSTCQPEV